MLKQIAKTLSLLLGKPLLALLISVSVISFLSILFFLPAKQVNATSSNATINFQARLLTNTGALVPDGNYNVEFKIYSGCTNEPTNNTGCTNDWTEDWYNVNSSEGIRVSDGYLTANLGSYCPLNDTSTCQGHSEGTIPWGAPLWLSINIGGTATGTPTLDGEMNPYLSMTSVPAAMSLTGTNGTYTSTLAFQSPNASQSILLPNDTVGATEYVCYQGDTGCGFAPTSGSTDYIQNAYSATQSANFNIQGSSGTAAVSVIEANNGGSGDILDLENGTSGKVATFSDSGAALFEASTNSTTAFQIQNSTNGSVFDVDTSNGRVGIASTYASLSVPTSLSVGAATSGGSLVDGNTYYYEVTAIDSDGGQTTASTEAHSATITGTNQTLPISWSSVSGASGYNVYRSTSSGGEVYLTTVLTNSFNDTGSITAGSVSPPGTSNAYVSTNAVSSLNQLSIGGNGTPTGQLYVSGNVPTTAAGSASTGTAPTELYVQGSYAYVVNHTANSMQIFDISNPVDPVSLSTVTTGSSPQDVYVSGGYAYITDSNAFQVINVYSPHSPTVLSTTNIGPSTGTAPYGIYVQGNYAFITDNTTLKVDIFNISNPNAPFIVGSVGTTSAPRDIYVQGQFAYVAEHGGGKVQIFNISNPASAFSVGSVTTNAGPQDVYVQGRYAYVTENSANNTLQVVDISNPAAPVVVGSVTTNAGPQDVYVQGRYAYVTNNSANTMQIIDVSNPDNPFSVGTTTTGSAPYGIYVNGNYAFVANDSANSLQSFNLGGEYTQQLEAGGITTGTLQTNGDATINGDLTLQGGLSVGTNATIGGNLGITGSVYIQGSLGLTGGIQGGISISNLSTPSAPTVTPTCTVSCTGSYNYEVSAVSASAGSTPASTAGSTSAQNTTLSGTNYNVISWSPVAGAVSYNVYRTLGGASQGLIANISSTTFKDTGSSASTAAPTLDTSGQLTDVGPATFEDDSSSATAFQVQNTSSNDIFDVDTNNNQVVIGSTTSGHLQSGQLEFATSSSGTAGSITLVTTATSSAFTLTLPAVTGTLCTVSTCSGGGSGFVDLAPSTAQTDSTTNPSIFIDKTGASGNLLQLQAGASPVNEFTVGYNGLVTLQGGLSPDITTANASSGTANSITIQPGSTSTNTGTGANLVLQGGNESGSATSIGGNINIDAGTGSSFAHNGVVNLGVTNASAIQIGSTTVAQTQTIGIGNNATSGSIDNVSIGSLIGTSATTIQGGVNGSTPTVLLQVASGGYITVGSQTASTANTINIGVSGSTTNNDSVNINSSTGANTGVTTIGGTNQTGNNLILQGEGISDVFSGSATAPSDVLKTSLDSATSLEVENANTVSELGVDTTAANNYVTDPEFSLASGGNPTDWSAVGSPTTFTQNTTASNSYEGQTSLKLTTSAANQGATTSTFTSSPSTAASGTGEYYNVSFYIKVSTGSFTIGNNFEVSATGGGNPTCFANTNGGASTIKSTGFMLMYCDLTFTSSSTISAISITDTNGSATTFYIDGVQLQQSSSNTAAPGPLQLGNLQLRGVITNPVTLQNTVNSTSAFQVQSTANTSVFQVDTLDGTVGIDQAPSSAGGSQLIVNGITQTSSLILSSSVSNNYIAKNFVTDGAVNANDVVVSVNNGSLYEAEDTTTSHNTSVIGVSINSVASGATTPVAISGNYQVTADVGTVNIGDQLVTSSTSGEVTADNSATTGIVGYATTSKVSGASGLVGIYIRPVGGVNNPDIPGNLTVQGTGTSSFAGNLSIETTTNSATALQVENNSGNQVFAVDTSGNQAVLGSNTAGHLVSGQLEFATSSSGTAGSITLQPTATSSTYTLTLPAATGTLCTVSACSAGGTGFVELAPSTVQADTTTTNPSIYIDKTGASGNLLQLQQNGSNEFIVGYNGQITLQGGQSPDITTALANSGTATAISIQPGVTSTNAGTAANLSLTGGNETGTATSIGGSVNIDAGTGSSFAHNGAVNIGTSNASTILVGSTTIAQAQTIDVGYNATASSIDSVNIGNLLSTSSTTIQGGTGGTSSIALNTGAGGGVTVSSLQPSSSSTAGTSAVNVFTVTGGAGGNTSGSGYTAGSGAGVSITGGAGGTAGSGSTNGNGGNVTLQGGSAGGGVGSAGSVGYVLLQPTSGNVGIGTSAPSAQLAVVGNSSSTTAASITGETSDSTTTALTVGNSTATLAQISDNGQISLGIGNVATLGYSKVGVNGQDGGYYNAGTPLLTGQEITTSGSGTVTSISVYAGSNVSSSPNNKFAVAIYTNSASGCTGGNPCPNTLVAQSSTTTLSPSSWSTVSISASLSASTTYWLMYTTNPTSSPASANGLMYDSPVTGSDYVYGTCNNTCDSSGFGNFPSSWTSTTSDHNSGTIAHSEYATLSGGSSPALIINSLGQITTSTTFQNSTNSTSDLQVQNILGNNVVDVDTTNNQLILGSSDNINGQLQFQNSTNTQTVSISAANQTTNSVALNIPNDSNTSDTICLQTLQNCNNAGASDYYLVQQPTSATAGVVGADVISPASGIVGLTVNGASTTSAVAAIFNQANNTSPADTIQVNTTSTGTQTNGILYTHNATGGTTANGINVTNTAGTLSNGLTLTATTAIGNGIDFTGAGGFTNLINATNFTVSNAGVVTLQGNQTSDITSNVTANNSNFTIKPGSFATNSDNGATLVLQGGNESGSTSTGGSVSIDAGTGTTNGNVYVGTSASAANAKNIYIGSVASAVSQTIDVGFNATASSTDNVNIGNLLGTSATTIQGGVNGSTPTVSVQAAGGGYVSIGTTNANTVTVGSTTNGNTALDLYGGATGGVSVQTGSGGTVNVGTTAQPETINIGDTTTANTSNTQTIDVGYLSGAGTTNVNIGSTSGANAGTTTVSGVTKVINISGNTTQTIQTTGETVQTTTNSSTAYQVQNSDGESILQAGTTSSTNYVADGDFANGSGSTLNDWTKIGSPIPYTQNTTAVDTYEGATSLEEVLAGANEGVETASSGGLTSAPTTNNGADEYYTVSFEALQTSGNLAANTFTITGINASGNKTCTGTIGGSGSTTLNANGFEQVYCTLQFTSGTAGSITQVEIQTSGATGTIYLDDVQLQLATSSSTSATPSAYQEGSLSLRGIITNPVSLQNVSNSQSALQVQNAAGSDLVDVDTLDGTVNLGTAINTNINIGTTTTSDLITIGGTTTTGALLIQGEGLTDTITGAASNPTDIINGSSTGLFQVKNTSGDVLNVNTSTNVVTVSAASATAASFVLNNPSGSAGIEFRSGASGSLSTFIGVNSGNNDNFSGTSGYQNTGVGNGALQGDSTGSYNTGFGVYALNVNALGSYDTAIGNGSLQALGTGAATANYNTALGNNTLNGDESGGSNTAIGSYSLYYNNSNDNTAVGAWALTPPDTLTTAQDDTALGYYAGAQDSTDGFYTPGTLQNATAIGYEAQVQANNSLVLGGEQGNAVNVGIGTTAPLNTFSVSPLYYYAGTASVASAGTTVTGVGTSWTSAMIGMQFIFSNGQTGIITAVGSGTSLTLGTSQPITAALNYHIQDIGFQVTNSGNAYVQNTSTTAFQVQNTAGTDLLQLDTSGNNVYLGATGSTALASNTYIGTSSSASNIQTITIGSNSDTSNTVTIDSGTAGSAIQIGNSNANHGIQIGTGTGVETVGLGSANSTSTTTIQGGVNGTTPTIQLQTATAGYIAIGNTSSAVTQNVLLGDNATASSVDNVTIGNLLGASATTIQGGTGNINLTTNSSSAGVILKSSTNSATAFEVENSTPTNVFSINTTTNASILGSSTLGGDLQFDINGSGNSISLAAPTTAPPSSYTLNLPTTDPSSGLCLETSTNTLTPGQLVFSACDNSNASISLVTTSDDTTSTSTIAGTTYAPAAAGNLVVVSFLLPTAYTGSVSGITDSNVSGGFTKVNASAESASNYGRVEVWMGTASSTSTGNSMNFTYAGGSPGAGYEIEVSEYTAVGVNAGTTWGVDTSGTSSSTTAVGTITFPNLTTSDAGELYFGAAVSASGDGQSNTGCTTNFTCTATTDHNLVSYDLASGANVSYAPVSTQSANSKYNTVGAAFIAYVSSTAINNQVSVQQANFNVQASSAGTVAGVLQANTSQNADILDFYNGSGIQSTSTEVLSVLGGSTTAGNIQFGGLTNQAITVTTQATANANGNTLQVVGQQGNGTGTGGELQLVGGAGGATSGTGGEVLIQGGSATAGTSNGGNVLIQGGAKTSTGTGGSVIIQPQSDNTQAFEVQNQANSYNELDVDTTNNQVVLGTSSHLGGQLEFLNSANADTVTLEAPNNAGLPNGGSNTQAASYSLVLPYNAPSPGLCLETSNTDQNQLTFSACDNSNASISLVTTSDDTTSTSSIAGTTYAPSTAGNLVVVSFMLPTAYTGSVSAITDSNVSGGFTKVNASAESSGNYGRVEVWMGTATGTSTSNNMSFTYTGGTPGAGYEIVVSEYTAVGVNAGTTWGVDTSGTSSSATAVSTITFPNLTTSDAGELYFGAANSASDDGQSNTGCTTNFTCTATTSHNLIAYNTASGANVSYTPVSTQSANSKYNTVGVAFIAYVSSTAINNQVSVQQANYNVQASSSSSVAGVLQANSSQNADIMDFYNGSAAQSTATEVLSVLGGSTTAGDIQFGGLTAETIAVTAQATANTAGASLTISSANGNGTGAGGQLKLAAGNSGAGATGTGGEVLIQGGNASSTNGNGGNVLIQGGVKAGTGSTGSVIIQPETNDVTTAFEVQNAAGTNTVLDVDTTLGGTYSNSGVIINSGVAGVSGLKFAQLTSTSSFTTNFTDILGLDANGNVGVSSVAVSLTSPALAYWDGTADPTVTNNSYPQATVQSLGTTTFTPSFTTANGEQLTDTNTAGNETGDINWNFAQVPFEEIQFQFKSGGGNGADGVWFYGYTDSIPHTEFGCTAFTGSTCTSTISFGYIVYFSEYHHCIGISYGAFTDGNQCNNGGGTTIGTGTSPLKSVSAPDLNDDNFHNVDIQIDYNVITVRYDGAVVLTEVDSVGRDTSHLNFGFGARTGGSYDNHYIKGLLVTKLGTGTSQYGIEADNSLANSTADTSTSATGYGSLYWNNSDGYLGVGAAAATSTLEVDGTLSDENIVQAYNFNDTACEASGGTTQCNTSQAGPGIYSATTTVTAEGSSSFSGSWVGDKITWANGDSGTIASVASSTSMTVNTSALEGTQQYQITDPTAFNINSSGNVGIGTSSPSYNLDVVGNAAATYMERIYNQNTTAGGTVAAGSDGLLIQLGTANASRTTGNQFIAFAGGTSGSGTVLGAIQGAASAVVYSTNAADYAEYFKADPNNLPQPGDIVSLDPSNPQGVVDSDGGDAVGVVSTQPGFVGNGPVCATGDDTCENDFQENNVIVGMTGQVPTNVSVANGAINVGDPIMASPTQPGVGEKATGLAQIVGYAEQAITTDGTILVLIQPGIYNPITTNNVQGGGTPLTLNSSLEVTGDTTLDGNLTIAKDLTASSVTVSSANVSGDLIVMGSISTGSLTVTGNTTLQTLVVSGQASFAGDIRLTGKVNTRQATIKTFTASKAITAGSVVVLDTTAGNEGDVTTTTTEGDPKVIGVAVTSSTQAGDSIDVAIGGWVQVNVDTTPDSNGNPPPSLTPGELLVTSANAGTVEASSSPTAGSILGKTTDNQDSNNQVWILITLQ